MMGRVLQNGSNREPFLGVNAARIFEGRTARSRQPKKEFEEFFE